MRRLRDQIGVEPVEYPTTRSVGSSPQDRARDLMAAYADPSVRAVLATIGGDDQITVLRHLDPAVFLADPKPFFGYSDNTNLLNWLWHHGVAGFHGGSTMVHMGRPGGLHPISAHSLRTALFGGDLRITPAEAFSEDEVRWDTVTPQSVDAADAAAPTVPGGDFDWHQPTSVLTAPTWGGNLEILHWTLAASRWIRPVADYAGCILLLETSEEMPSATDVFRMLRNMGERGLLQQFPAVVVGRPKSAHLDAPRTPEKRERYRAEQKEAVLASFAAYNPEAMLVFGVDIGHTDPQWVLPYGGLLTVDGPGRAITAHYGPAQP